MTRTEALERVAEAAWDWLKRYDEPDAAFPPLHGLRAALDALPVSPAGETVEVRAAVFSNGGEAWTVYGSSHMSDSTVVENAKSDLLDGGDEEHVGWINAKLVLPSRRLPEVSATVETER